MHFLFIKTEQVSSIDSLSIYPPPRHFPLSTQHLRIFVLNLESECMKTLELASLIPDMSC